MGLSPQKASSPVSKDEIETLLKRWLSVAESQACALEVLGNQIPKINTLLEENMIAISKSFNVLAGEAQDQAKNIAMVVVAATEMEIGGKTTSVREAIMNLGNGAGDVAQEIKDIKSAIAQQEKKLDEALKVSQVSYNKMLGAVTSAIVGMQFQDRVSQNLKIAENVSKEIVRYLKETVGKTSSALGDGASGVLDTEFAKRLASLLTLGELQRQFADHLLAQGYIQNVEQVGIKPEAKEQGADEVELF